MKALLTTNIAEAMTFNSFGAANEAGDKYLGVDTFKVSGKGGIRISPPLLLLETPDDQ
jgi:hypothetical protein